MLARTIDYEQIARFVSRTVSSDNHLLGEVSPERSEAPIREHPAAAVNAEDGGIWRPVYESANVAGKDVSATMIDKQTGGAVPTVGLTEHAGSLPARTEGIPTHATRKAARGLGLAPNSASSSALLGAVSTDNSKASPSRIEDYTEHTAARAIGNSNYPRGATC
ncbi:MAG TPA: hypothetical protein VNA31_02375, partial [bacterium]|nr:hypothetical protein [bacterium]